MKKVLFIITIFSLVISCSKENEETYSAIQKTNANVFDFKDNNDFSTLVNFSEVHSLILDKNLESLNNQNINFIDSNGIIDTLSLINFFEKETHLNMSKITFKYNNVIIENNPNNIYLITDKVKFDNFANPVIKSVIVKEYFDKINDSKDNINNIKEWEFHLNNIYNTLLTEKESMTVKDIKSIELMIGIAYDSVKFCTLHSNGGEPSEFTFSWGIALADIIGAGQYGVIGAAAGPPGAIIVGINGAIINSSIAHAINSL